MRRCRKAEASGSPATHRLLPEELKPFLDVLAEMLAEALLRDPESSSSAEEVDVPNLNQSYGSLESAPEDSPEASEEA